MGISRFKAYCIYLRKYKVMIAFSIILQHGNDDGKLKSIPIKTMTLLYYAANIVAADVLVDRNPWRFSDTIRHQRSRSTFGSGNGLLPDGTKPLPQLMLTSSVGFCGINPRPISQEVFKMTVHKMSLKNTLVKLLPHLPGANELIPGGLVMLTCSCEPGQHCFRSYWWGVSIAWLQLKPLIHWGWDKMAATLLMTFSNVFFLKKIYEFPIDISLRFVPKGKINNIPSLVQIMAWRLPGDKPLS